MVKLLFWQNLFYLHVLNRIHCNTSHSNITMNSGIVRIIPMVNEKKTISNIVFTILTSTLLMLIFVHYFNFNTSTLFSELFLSAFEVVQVNVQLSWTKKFSSSGSWSGWPGPSCNLKVWNCHYTCRIINSRLCETARPWFQNSRLKDEKSPKNVTLRPKHFQDFETGPKFSKSTHIFQGTILYPLY